MAAADHRYRRFDGGPDPLAPPFDVAAAVDEMGEAVLDGASPRSALDQLLRRGVQGRRGLADLLRQVRERQREVRRRGRLDGTLQEVRRLLDTAVGQERAALFPDPDDAARLAEAELDALPRDTARAVRQLADYRWRSPAAQATYEKIKELLAREVLDSQFRGIKQALQEAGAADRARLQEMLAALNALLEADAQGHDTGPGFDDFMARFADFFPERPGSLDELVDALARRAAAAGRLARSLSPAQRQELADLVAATLADLGLAGEMARLSAALRAARPDLDWGGAGRSERLARRLSAQGVAAGDVPADAAGLGLGDATTVLEELAELDELANALGQDYPGASLEDVDPEAVRQALGRQAVDDLAALQRLERELERQGYLARSAGRLELTPRAIRRLGAAALARVFRGMAAAGRGPHDVADAGAAGELTGTSRPWRFGDEQPLDVGRTLRNAVLRQGPVRRDDAGPLRLAVEDFEVVDTERRTRAAVCLLVDLSYSMALRGTWGLAKSTALALHALVDTRFPQDVLRIIGFSDYARLLTPTELAELDVQMVQGTNLQHALLLAGRELSRYPDAEPIVLVVTDGEPTAHLQHDGQVSFAWPPEARTLELTMAEVDRLTRRGVTINVFMLDDDPRLVDFVEELARRNGGRVLCPSAQRLGQYVVSDYVALRTRRRAAR